MMMAGPVHPCAGLPVSIHNKNIVFHVRLYTIKKHLHAWPWTGHHSTSMPSSAPTSALLCISASACPQHCLNNKHNTSQHHGIVSFLHLVRPHLKQLLPTHLTQPFLVRASMAVRVSLFMQRCLACRALQCGIRGVSRLLRQ